MLHVGMVLGFLQTWCLVFRPNSSILVHQTRGSFTEEWLPAGHSTKKARLRSGAERLALLEGSPISTKELWSSVRMTNGFSVTSLTKALLAWLLSLAGRPALGTVLVVPNFFHLRMMEATVLGDLQCCRNVLVPFPRSVPQHNSVFDLMAWLLLWLELSTVGLFIKTDSVPFQIMSNQLNLPQVDSNQVVETQGWSMETGCTWAQFRVS